MRPWKHTVLIGDLLDRDEVTFEARRDGIVARLRASAAMTDGWEGETLGVLVEDLSKVLDADEYDSVMESIYDLADSGKWLWVGP